VDGSDSRDANLTQAEGRRIEDEVGADFMKSPYITELQPNQVVNITLLVQQKDIRQKKTGEPCLSLILGDRTGDIEARMWDNVAEVMDTFERDDFVKVRGLPQVHHNRLQLTIQKIQRQDPELLDFTDFFPASERNAEEMWGELLGTVAGIGNPHLRSLLNLIVGDPEIARRYKVAPAAKHIHHAFLGGLLDHVLSMCSVGKLLASHYKDVDLDLLLTGIILHDVGKIHELTYDRSFGYSTEGQLLGHIIIGIRLIGEKLRTLPDFPPQLRTLLEHLLISHHGELEFGSPKLPMFAEAILLHQIDSLDSRMDCIRSSLHRDRHVGGCWTGYSSALERPLLKKKRYLEQCDEALAPACIVSDAEAVATPRERSKTSSIFADKLQSALRRNE
jgi:3'-5' exoribonuclease